MLSISAVYVSDESSNCVISSLAVDETRPCPLGLLDEPDDLLRGESALLHVRPRG